MPIPAIPFGRLGHLSTRTVFGASALEEASEEVAGRTLDLLLKYGVNHIDVSPSDGDAEVRLAPWFKQVPGHFFVGTKTTQRTAVEATEELHRSLDRTGLDYIDLWQIQNLADERDWEVAFGAGGVIEAAVEAKREGLVGGIGVTGHGSRIVEMHRRSLERFDFDSVLAPYNYTMMQNSEYAENFDALYATCLERNIGVLTMKAIAYAPLSGEGRTHATWYKPLEKQEDIDVAIWWALARPGIFLATASDLGLLPMVLDAASRFEEGTSQASLEKYLASLSMVPLFN